MALIDVTYFKGPVNIAGIAASNSPVVGNAINTDWIPLYEKEYLKKALGLALYAEFDTALGYESGTPPGSIATKWTDLRDGKSYTVDGETYEWVGFKNAAKQSPIAQYVYVMYMTNIHTQTTSQGEAKNTQKNAVNADPNVKLTAAWLKLDEYNNQLWHFLENNESDYTTFEKCKTGSFDNVKRNRFGI